MRAHGAAVACAFVIAFAASLVLALLQGPKPFYADSGSYWSLASSFAHDGHFSLLNFHSPLRGYAMALITYVLRWLAHSSRWSNSAVVKVFNAALFAAIGTVLAPRIATATWPSQHWGTRRRLALATLLIVFWSGDLNYPLSDFPGLALALFTLIAIAHPQQPSWMLIAGAAGGLAVDIRPAYLLLMPALVAIAAWTWLRRSERRRSLVHSAACVGLLALGFAAVSLPQSLAYHRYYGSWSFLPGGPNLSDEQLTAGTSDQRYDTFVRPDGQAFAMIYPDAAGARVLRSQRGDVVSGPLQYAEMLADHPLTMTDVTVRHLVNGLDMRYSTVYVEHLDSGGHLGLRLAGFVLVFLALVRLLWRPARAGLGPTRRRYPAALLVCCLTSVFGAMETRYLLPAWLLLYMLVLAPGWPHPHTAGASSPTRLRAAAVLAAAGLVFTAFVWGLLSGVNAHLVT
jgi:hypothetical protein